MTAIVKITDVSGSVSVLSALSFMHAKDVIHRDIKPSNIMGTKVDEESVFKLIDFSIYAVKQDALTTKSSYRHTYYTVALLTRR